MKKPKTLTGFAQNGNAAGCFCQTGNTRTLRLPAYETGAKSSMSLERNIESPTSRLFKAGASARNADGMVGRGGWKKRTLLSNRADRGCNIIPLRKQADFQLVVNDERVGRTCKGGKRK